MVGQIAEIESITPHMNCAQSNRKSNPVEFDGIGLSEDDTISCHRRANLSLYEPQETFIRKRAASRPGQGRRPFIPEGSQKLARGRGAVATNTPGPTPPRNPHPGRGARSACRTMAPRLLRPLPGANGCWNDEPGVVASLDPGLTSMIPAGIERCALPGTAEVIFFFDDSSSTETPSAAPPSNCGEIAAIGTFSASPLHFNSIEFDGIETRIKPRLHLLHLRLSAFICG